MGHLDGRQAANDHLVEMAKVVAAAAFKAPQITRRTQIKVDILFGEDILPIVEILSITGENSVVTNGDAVTFKKMIEKGTPPVFVVVGAVTNRSELNWNCGACGFATCGEFNRYARSIAKNAVVTPRGPMCVWKAIDAGAAVDYGAIAAWDLKVDNRVMGTVGSCAMGLGYVEGCNYCQSVTLGPIEDMVYYDRESLKNAYTEQNYRDWIFRGMPHHFRTFPGGGDALYKHDSNWEKVRKNVRLVDEDPGIIQKRMATSQRILAIRQQVLARRQELSEARKKRLLEGAFKVDDHI